MAQMTREQPFIQVYVASICERGDFEDANDADAFANIASIVWYSMRRAAGKPFAQVSGEDIEAGEKRMFNLYDYAEGEPEEGWFNLVQVWLKNYNQRPLFEFVINELMSPENPYGITPEGGGVIFTHVKVIIDCLDGATD